MSILGNERII